VFKTLFSYLVIAGCSTGICHAEVNSYAVVVSQATQADREWAPVVAALVEKHDAQVIAYDDSVEESLPALQSQFPRYVCFVAKPSEAGRKFVAQAHQLTRKLDDDIYTDALWGILTGFDAQNALEIARYKEPLLIGKAAGGTEIALPMCDAGVWYCELNKNKFVRKEAGKEPETKQGPDDTTEALVDVLNKYQPGLWVTSGHATEHDWQIGFRYRNGFFRSEGGQLYGLDTQQQRFDVKSPNPKVFMPIGNCLAGHIDGPEAMALAYMKSAGVRQMLGYTVPTWYGYGGWGCLDYFVEQPGRYTFTEAFFANHQALLHKLQASRGTPDERGLAFDRDVVAFYGDPAWEARMAPHECAYSQKFSHEADRYVFEITPNRGADSFRPINTNGSQRGGRPIVEWLPERLTDIEIVEGRDLRPVIADNFILVPNPGTVDAERKYRVVFHAKPIKKSTKAAAVQRTSR
jgi:zinc protease